MLSKNDSIIICIIIARSNIFLSLGYSQYFLKRIPPKKP